MSTAEESYRLGQSERWLRDENFGPGLDVIDGWSGGGREIVVRVDAF
jgi:hypothetical protein